MESEENQIIFQINSEGRVVRYLPIETIATLDEQMQLILQEVAHKTAKYMQRLLKEKLEEIKKSEGVLLPKDSGLKK